MNKLRSFQKQLKETQKQIFLVAVTTMGLKKNAWSEELVQGQITLNDLF